MILIWRLQANALMEAIPSGERLVGLLYGKSR